jgi:putative ABC transport system permease protein
VRVNGVVVGVAGALIGAVLGLAGWLAYRPTVESNSHHVIGVFQLPWAVIAAAMALGVVATFFAASRPGPVHHQGADRGRPVRTAGSAQAGAPVGGAGGRPPRGRRGAVLVRRQAEWWGGLLEVALGFIVLIAAVILLSPLFLATLARAGRRAPIAVRLALRDLARYRARSGSALAAISLGVLVAVLVCVLSAQRYGNVLDYAGPNLASDRPPADRVNA